MLRSMTGYGRGAAQGGGLSVVVELRSVNNRFLDLVARLPREWQAIEVALLRPVRARLHRGRVEVMVRRDAVAPRPVVQVDEALAGALAGAARRVAGTTAADGCCADGDREALPPVLAAWVLAQPGVVSVMPPDIAVDAEGAVAKQALDAALDALIAMREREGEALRADLVSLAGEVEAEVHRLDELASAAPQQAQARLHARLERLLGDHGADPGRLAQEVAILADKADVAEELARLRSHLDQVRGLMDADEPVGRPLDFLMQELHREANTLGVKCVDPEAGAAAVRVKSLIERMREQTANVE